MTWSMPANPHHTFDDRFMTVFLCFSSNAAAIHFEDMMINIYKRSGGTNEPKVWKSLLGYLWVIGWIWFTCCWGATAYLRMGMTGVNEVLYPIMGILIDSLGLPG